MEHGMTNVVRIGKEVTRGTAVAGTLTVPFLGDGWKISIENHLAMIKSSSTFPYPTKAVPLGRTPTVRGSPEVNIATIHDIIDMAWVRTLGKLPSLTIEETSAGVGQQKAAGCVCQSLGLSFSRSDTPDESALLAAEMEFAAMSIAAATGITAGTYGAGASFSLAKSIFTLNAVQASDVMSFSWRITNQLHLGPHDANGAIQQIIDGEETNEIELTALFKAEAWRDLVKNATTFAAQFVLDTGGTLETVTLNLGVVNASTHELQNGDIVIESIKPVAVHTGSVRPVNVTFGTGIGVSALALD